MFNNNNNLNLEEMEKRLELLKRQQINPNQKLGGAFGKLQDYMQNIDNKEKINFANNDPEVVQTYNTMKDIFCLYMLESNRNQFEMWCKDRNLSCVDNYVDTFISKTKNYVPKEVNEIELLKKEIANLKSQLSNREVI